MKSRRSIVTEGPLKTPEKGYLAIVLHAHLPFVRHPEHEDALEENWLYEGLTETYIPLLLVFDSLLKEGIDFRLTLSISPTLASMLIDPFLQSRYLQRLERLIELAQKEVKRTASDPAFSVVARMYRKRLLEVHAAYVKRYDRNLIQAFQRLSALGKVELMASAATHGYLPLLSPDESAVRAQIRIGIDYYQQLFGSKPRGFWLPECAFYPGVDRILTAEGIRYTIVETHGVTRSSPRAKYGVYAPLSCPSGLTVFGRDPESSRQVWSSVEGYPGDYDYREFYRDIAYDLDFDYIKPYIHRDGIRTDTGFKYYRITGKTNRKEAYIPQKAEQKAQLHAADFILNRRKKIEYLASVMDRKPIVVAPYDAELFGHWWFEGPMWLNYLLRTISLEQKTMRLVTLSEYLQEYPTSQVSLPSVSSWGNKGFHETWLNKSNDWIYPHLHHCSQVMKKLVQRHPRARGLMLRALKQAARELLQAQTSDWAFMINGGALRAYATERIKTHLLRFEKLSGQIENGVIDGHWLSAIEGQNNIFPEIDFRLFS